MSQEPFRPFPSGPDTPSGLSGLADRLRALPPSCGPVRLIAVDGHAGSGKSTFARHLAAALGGAPVVRLDDVATHEELFDWTARLRAEVLEPLSRGERARYRVYDWVRREFTVRRELAPAHAVVVEGVGAGRRALRPYLACLLWMDLTAGHSWERGRLRDGPELNAFWDDWILAERAHFSADPSRPHAGLLVRAGTEGYEVLPGPGGTAGTP
ncbi:uridine kinase [Streptomyces sp. NPDC059788]|uniref:uridine kinase family protein n=1 Tax=Streptomyces sp. NPDC059788 TaxID=3346948 RepID=UPI00366A31B1